MLRQPQEIEVWYVIPAIRRELAEAMVAEGMLQKDIAAILGITSSAVSQYLHNKRAKMVNLDPHIKEEIKKVAKRARAGENIEIVKEINRFCEMCRATCLCQIHRKVDTVPEKCTGCFK